MLSIKAKRCRNQGCDIAVIMTVWCESYITSHVPEEQWVGTESLEQ